MRNQATKMNRNQLALFSGGEAVEDLLYEFLKNRSPLTERAYRRDLKAFFERHSPKQMNPAQTFNRSGTLDFTEKVDLQFAENSSGKNWAG